MKPSMRFGLILLAFCTWHIQVHAQASAGFVKISTVTSGTSYQDSGCLNMTSCAYQVTTAGTNGLESAPAACGTTQLCLAGNQAVVVMPSSGTHTVTISWTASTSTGVAGYNIYRENSPVAGSALTTTVN